MTKTPLYDSHVARGARLVEFEKWQMPLQFSGILPEHRHTRNTVSLFDTCHMTQFRVEGPKATEVLSRALACRITSMQPGQCRYGFLLNQSGGVIDDLICYRSEEQQYMIVSNAGTRKQVCQVLDERIGDAASFADISDETAKLDLQGPASARVLRELYDAPVSELGFFQFMLTELGDFPVFLSRTGYTGELGYELYLDTTEVVEVWDRLLQHDDVEPAGLGARDTLRLEMGLPLYGHELDESTTPLEAGLGRFLPDEASYVGEEGIDRQREDGLDVKRVGIQWNGRRAARSGDDIILDGEEVGTVTSGAFAPSLGCAVAMGYVETEIAKTGQELEAAVRSHRVQGTVEELPFYREGTSRTSVKGGVQ